MCMSRVEVGVIVLHDGVKMRRKKVTTDHHSSP